jgi:hypothetical protein
MADFEVRDLAEVTEEIGGYLDVFEHYIMKVGQSKCHHKRVLKLDWEDVPRGVK